MLMWQFLKGGLTGALVTLTLTTLATAQPVRVSVGSDGTQANGSNSAPSISESGRFVAFASAATNLVAGDTNDASDIFLRDRDIDGDGIFDEPGAVSTSRVSVGPGGTQANGRSDSPVVSGDGRFVFFISSATNLVTPSISAASQIYRFDRLTGAVTFVGVRSADVTACWAVDASGDGRYIAIACGGPGPSPTQGSSFIFACDLETGETTRLSLPQPVDWQGYDLHVASPTISADGRLIAFADVRHRIGTVFYNFGTVTLANRVSGDIRRDIGRGQRVVLSADGTSLFVIGDLFADLQTHSYWQSTVLDERVVARELVDGVSDVSPNGRYVATRSHPSGLAKLYDRSYGLFFPLPYGMDGVVFDELARTVAFTSGRDDVLGAGQDTNGVADIFVADLRSIFDADQDGLDDRDETFYGLSPVSGTGADGPNGDPDGDGLTNAQELASGSHPTATYAEYLAEGSESAFFHTRLALVNPAATGVAGVVVRFLRSDGIVVSTPVSVPAMTRATVVAGLIPELNGRDFSMAIDSSVPLVVDRTMSWPSGSHGETAVAAPSRTWFLAEGTTVLDFELFYLLQNPGDAAATATVRFLRPADPPLEREYELAPHSRTTIYVNRIATLEETDVSAEITATAPIVVERAMYRSRAGEIFTLGHDARGQTQASTRWFLAEGATGTFFDTYVLIANPGAAPVDATASFLRGDGTVVTQTFRIRANARFTIFVDSLPGLEATAVATAIEASGPVVIERAMYWPTGFFEYYEGHVSGGATAAGSRWILAEGETGGAADTDTYVLIANTSGTSTTATVRPVPENPFEVLPVSVTIPAHSRVTVRARSIPGASGRHGVEVLETGTPLTGALVVEGAMYASPDGVFWSSGTGWLATRVP